MELWKLSEGQLYGTASSELCVKGELKGDQTTIEEAECHTRTSGQKGIRGKYNNCGIMPSNGELGCRMMTEKIENHNNDELPQQDEENG